MNDNTVNITKWLISMKDNNLTRIKFVIDVISSLESLIFFFM